MGANTNFKGKRYGTTNDSLSARGRNQMESGPKENNILGHITSSSELQMMRFLSPF